jgi:voltage-gated potassium channel Kch
MPTKVSLRQRLKYRFDNLMGKGMIAMIGALFAIGAAIGITIGVIVWQLKLGPAFADGKDPSLWEMISESALKGINLALVRDHGYAFMILMLVLAFTTAFVGGAFIGAIGSGITTRLQELRKGRSLVVERGHTVLLGWSHHIFPIISELIIASANKKHSCIVILAEKGKVEMEDAIRGKIPKTGRTRIVCRTGSAIDMADLQIVNPDDAASFIVLSPDATDDPDSHVIKTVLALTNNPQRQNRRYHIVAELKSKKSMEVMNLIAPDEVRPVLVDELIARITVQTCLQAGLSVVYNELLDFGGDEIYVHREPGLEGRPFRDALLAYDKCAPLGVCRKDGGVVYKPAFDSRIEPGDRIIVIAEDDDKIVLRGGSPPAPNAEAIVQREHAPPRQKRTLVLGWNRKGIMIIDELDAYVAPGSLIVVVADTEAARGEIGKRSTARKNVQVEFQRADPSDRQVLDELDVGSYQHIIVLAYDHIGPQEADARTLVSLLHLRDIAKIANRSFSIVSEMLDIRNRELAEVTRADDFIVSDRLVSLMLSQMAESRDLTLTDLFDAEGSELYLRPAADYVTPGKPVDFYTVVESAARRNEIAVGYRLSSLAGDRAMQYGVVVNPVKSQSVTFSETDRILVLADS